MPSVSTATACAKAILIGEHSVVYGRPAIALPLSWMRSTASIAPRSDERIEIIAPDVNARYFVDVDPGRPLAKAVMLTLAHLGSTAQGFQVLLRSQIPVGGHLGSGAAASVAVARAVATFVGHELSAPDASALAFEIEKHHHGTPSGIDNTVIAHEQPIWFVRSAQTDVQVVESDDLLPTLADRLVIADSGITTSTKTSVEVVRAGWQKNRLRYEAWFDEIEGVAHHARMALYDHDWSALGLMMDHNHEVLRELNVSCTELETLVHAAKQAGALGAKLTGGGMGGNMIALAQDAHSARELALALKSAGAKQVYAQCLL